MLDQLRLLVRTGVILPYTHLQTSVKTENESRQLLGGHKEQKLSLPIAMVTEVSNIVVRSPPDVLEVVRGGDDLGGAGVEVVVGVLGDDGAAAHEVVAVAEDEAGPGELSGRGLSVLQPPHWARVLSTPGLIIELETNFCEV